MAGLGLALVGGALKGFGEGQLASIKAMREEKLKQLDYEHAEKLQGSQQSFLAREGAANRASQEAQTKAQQETSLQLGKLSSETQRYGVDVSSETQKELSKNEIAAHSADIIKQITSGETIASADRASREKLSGDQISASKDLQQMQIDAAAALNAKFELQEDGTSVYMVGGKPVKMPIDPATHKPMNPAITSTDTPEMRNIKYLVANGLSFESAKNTILNAKNDNRNLAQVTIFKAMTDGASTMKNLNDEDLRRIWTQSGDFTDQLFKSNSSAAPAPAPGTPSSAADPGSTVPAAPAAQVKPLPPGTTRADLIDAAKAMVKAGTSKTAAGNRLLEYGIEPAEAGL